MEKTFNCPTCFPDVCEKCALENGCEATIKVGINQATQTGVQDNKKESEKMKNMTKAQLIELLEQQREELKVLTVANENLLAKQHKGKPYGRPVNPGQGTNPKPQRCIVCGKPRKGSGVDGECEGHTNQCRTCNAWDGKHAPGCKRVPEVIESQCDMCNGTNGKHATVCMCKVCGGTLGVHQEINNPIFQVKGQWLKKLIALRTIPCPRSGKGSSSKS